MLHCLRVEFETALESDTCNLSPIINILLDEFGEDIHFLRDHTRGGVATELNELAKDCGWGIDITHRDIPLKELAEGVFEMLGLDPFYVTHEGIFIMVVNPIVASKVLDTLLKSATGKNATIVGTVTNANRKQVILTSSIGGKRMLNMLTGEQLRRIC